MGFSMTWPPTSRRDRLHARHLNQRPIIALLNVSYRTSRHASKDLQPLLCPTPQTSRLNPQAFVLHANSHAGPLCRLTQSIAPRRSLLCASLLLPPGPALKGNCKTSRAAAWSTHLPCGLVKVRSTTAFPALVLHDKVRSRYHLLTPLVVVRPVVCSLLANEFCLGPSDSMYSSAGQKGSLPSPDRELGGVVPMDQRSPGKMLNIRNLLNPEQNVRFDTRSISPPLNPDSAMITPSPTTASSPNTPISPVKQQKLVKDGAVFHRGQPAGDVNYGPFECTSAPLCLTPWENEELLRQHVSFGIFPSGKDGEGLIQDYTRHIPYSSEKKPFYGKTGREAFEGKSNVSRHLCLSLIPTVFQYTFVVPDDPPGRKHTVMWDYQVGLVRITPFFKACHYSKVRRAKTISRRLHTADHVRQTTPAKALNTNPGLKELSHSITGGALAAQGYWVPYACARAICLSFCHQIRWALTPIFGHSFVKECLRPDHPDFARFKVDSEVVRNAQLEADGWRLTASRSGTPDSVSAGPPTARDIPRSVPNPVPAPKQLRPRREKPSFKLGSPFEPKPACSEPSRSAVDDSPALSPKSTRRVPAGWTSVNTRSHPAAAEPRDHLLQTLPQSLLPSLSQALLIEPAARASPTSPWRAGTSSPTATGPPASTRQQRCGGHKRRQQEPDGADGGADGGGDASRLWPPPSPHAKKVKRLQREGSSCSTTHAAAEAQSEAEGLVRGKEQLREAAESPKSVKFTSEDLWAAKCMLQLHEDDAASDGRAAGE